LFFWTSGDAAKVLLKIIILDFADPFGIAGRVATINSLMVPGLQCCNSERCG